jgi:tetratricopeptide (TPR) repeat protein
MLNLVHNLFRYPNVEGLRRGLCSLFAGPSSILVVKDGRSEVIDTMGIWRKLFRGLSPNSALKHVKRGQEYEELGDYANAIQEYTAAIRIDPKHPSSYGLRGTAHARLGRHREAITDFTDSMHFDYKGLLTQTNYFTRGLSHDAMGNYQEAIDDLTEAIRLNPQHGQAYLWRARSYTLFDMPEKAARDSDRAIALGLDRVEVTRLLANISDPEEEEEVVFPNENLKRSLINISDPEEEEEVVFPDENLEAAVRSALNEPEGPITRTALKRLEMLTAEDTDIENLTGLEYGTNLTKLGLRRNQISDVTPLASLANLMDLFLGENQISDVTPLASLANLKGLVLSDNQISDVTPLASLANLTHLLLSGNQISDVTPLASLTYLTLLALSENQISDVTPLASLTNLTVLILGNNPLSRESIEIHIPRLESRGLTISL